MTDHQANNLIQLLQTLNKNIESLGFPRQKYGVRKDVLSPAETDKEEEYDLNCLSFLVEVKATSATGVYVDGQDAIAAGQSREFSNKMGLDYVGKTKITPVEGKAHYQITRFILVNK